MGLTCYLGMGDNPPGAGMSCGGISMALALLLTGEAPGDRSTPEVVRSTG